MKLRCYCLSTPLWCLCFSELNLSKIDRNTLLLLGLLLSPAVAAFFCGRTRLIHKKKTLSLPSCCYCLLDGRAFDCTLLLLVDSCILLLLLLLLLAAWSKLEITDLLQDLNPNLLWMLSCCSLLLLLLLQLKTRLWVLDDPWAVPELNSPGSCEVSFCDFWSSWVLRAWSFWRAVDILERKEYYKDQALGVVYLTQVGVEWWLTVAGV